MRYHPTIVSHMVLHGRHECYLTHEEPGMRSKGGEREPNNFLSQESGICRMFKTQKNNPYKKVMKNTNQHDRKDPHKITKIAKEEWDQTDTWLVKYGQNSKRMSG
jgi:hypothetical protein